MSDGIPPTNTFLEKVAGAVSTTPAGAISMAPAAASSVAGILKFIDVTGFGGNKALVSWKVVSESLNKADCLTMLGNFVLPEKITRNVCSNMSKVSFKFTKIRF